MTTAVGTSRVAGGYGERIREAVRQAQAGNPLAPVTVLCGGSAMDDVLVALTQPGEPLLNVEVATLPLFVTTAARTLGRKPLQRADVAREVGLLLADAASPTVFHTKHLNTSPATHRGLTDAILTLSALPPQWRGLHGGEELPGVVEKLARTVLERTAATCYTYPEAVEAAAQAAARRAVVVVGDIALDALSEWTLGQLGDIARVDGGEFAGAIERATFVAERDEAKYVASAIADAVGAGAQLAELAVGCCDETQIAAVSRALEEAGISHRAPSSATWAQNAYFRALAGLVRLDPEEMNRRDIAGLLGTGALDGAPWLNAFDQITRDDRLQFYAGTDWDRQPQGLSEDRAAQAAEVLGWVRGLRSALRRVWSSPSWPAAAAELRQLAADRMREPWGIEATYLDAACETLAGLHGAVERGRAVDALLPLYDNPQPAAGGGLVAVGPLESLAGRNLHTAFIVGALDDTLPGSITPSPTITAAQSHTSAEEFLGRRRRAMQAALRSAPRVVITNPRSHQNGSGTTQPSQWVSARGLRALGAKVKKLAVEDFPQAEAMLADGTLAVLSDFDQLIVNAAAGNPGEDALRYRAIMGYRDAGAYGDEEGAEFNGFAGGAGSAVGREFFASDISNSALESFTASPLLFFIDHILKSYALPDEVHTLAVDAREGGSLFHAIIEAWTNEVLLNPASPPDYDSEDWWADAKRRLDAIVSRELQRAGSERVNEAVWFSFEDATRRDVERWYAAEKAELKLGWRPIAAELAFGANRFDGTEFPSPYIDVPGAGGATERITFNGKIDRVDYLSRPGQPTKLRITDYKTGKQFNTVKSLLAAGPTGEAEKNDYRFQLALYGGLVHRRFVEDASGDVLAWFPEVADALAGLPSVSAVEARYWYVQEKTGPEDAGPAGVVSITIDDAVLAALETNLGRIHSYITAGVFPPHALNASWVEQREVRVGRAQYEAVTDALAERALIPLSIEEPR